MLRIVEAPPRSGKTFYGVNYLCKHFCEYDALYKEWVLKPGILVVSNIEGLKVKHRDLAKILKDMSPEEFFTIENFEKLMDKYKASNVVLLIDEAQFIFDNKFYNKDVFYFFQYHGHIGVDIFLFTQGVSTLCRHFIPLVEFIIKVSPRSKSVAGTFMYKFVDKNGNYLYSETCTKDQKVFQAYKSMRNDEITKPKNAILRYALLVVGLVVGSFFLFKVAIASVAGGRKPTKPAPVANAPVYKNVSAAVMKNNTSNKLVALLPVAPVNEWKLTKVRAYYRIDGIEKFHVKNLVLSAGECKNYDSFSKVAFCRSASVADAESVPDDIPVRSDSSSGAIAKDESGYSPMPDVKKTEIEYFPSAPVVGRESRFVSPSEYEALKYKK